MRFNTKIVICNNNKRYLEVTFRQLCDARIRFSQIEWEGELPRGYAIDDCLFDFIMAKVTRPECFSSYEGDFKCYGIDHYYCDFKEGLSEPNKPVKSIINKLRVLVKEE